MFKFVPALLMEQMITPCTSKPKLVEVVSLPGRSSLASFNLSWGRDQSNRPNIWETIENFCFTQLDFLFILCCKSNNKNSICDQDHTSPDPPFPLFLENFDWYFLSLLSDCFGGLVYHETHLVILLKKVLANQGE